MYEFPGLENRETWGTRAVGLEQWSLLHRSRWWDAWFCRGEQCWSIFGRRTRPNFLPLTHSSTAN